MKQANLERYLRPTPTRAAGRRRHAIIGRRVLASLILGTICLASSAAFSQVNLLDSGWQLDRAASNLRFQSIKNGATVETSSFANFDGALDANGLVTLLVELNSVDTNVDLRNVRMRFLFFETFKFPVAAITTRVEPETLRRLAVERRINLPVEFELDLHGVRKTLTAETVLTLFTDDQIAITSASPVTIAAEDFSMMEGILKLQEAANVEIVPSGSVSFDFTFKRNASSSATQPATNALSATTAESQAPANSSHVALESAGNFSTEECIARFDTLSQTGAINFTFGSSEVDPVSYPLLETLRDIIERCPSLRIVVEGHTDDSGPDDINQQLSSARAQGVIRYLLQQGVSADRIRSVGYGESSPLVPNDTRRNRARNRRIEFTIDGQ